MPTSADGSADDRSYADWQDRVKTFFNAPATYIQQLTWETKFQHNAESLSAVDSGMSRATNGELGLGKFVIERPPRKATAGGERYFVEADTLPALLGLALLCKRRYCIESNVTGERRLENAWSGRRSVLHEVLDQGSIRQPFRRCLYNNQNGACIRGTLACDPMHRRHNRFLHNVARTGVREMKLEITVVLGCRKGKFKAAANYWQIQKTAESFFARLLYTSDAADELPCLHLGGRRTSANELLLRL